MSRPRAATSVATSTSRAPSRKRPITRSRCSWERPPWSAAASCPRPLEGLGQVVHLAPRPGEDERGGGILDVEDPAQRRELVGSAHDVDELAELRPVSRRRPVARDARDTRTGSRRWRAATRAIGGGIVAEKRAVWRAAGVAERIASSSSAKPMSSISSASSRMTTSTLSRRRLPRVRWSTARPGVATTTWSRAGGPAAAGRSAARRRRGGPGRRGRARSGGPPRRPASPARGSARGPGRRDVPASARPRPPAASRWRIGRAKAAVLPVPVGASASRSRPARRGGIAASWTGVGSS